MKTKDEYLATLEFRLNDADVSKKEIESIIKDYETMYNEALDNGKTDEEIYEALGSPASVVRELLETIKEKNDRIEEEEDTKKLPGREKIIALSPFISTIVYFILGFVFKFWHPGWLVFFLTPMVAIIFEGKKVALALSPFVATIFFILFGHFTGIYHPTWLIFLMVPMLGILFDTEKSKVTLLLNLVVFVGSIVAYLLLYKNYGEVMLLVFLAPLLTAIISGYINVEINNKHLHQLEKNEQLKVLLMILSVFVSVSAFVIVSLATKTWSITWLILLIIPVSALLIFDKKHSLVAYTPFVCLAAFMLLGHFFHLWSIAWLVFFLIPICGILTNNERDKTKTKEQNEEDYIEHIK